MTYDWFKCEFTAAELNGKSVAFKMPIEGGRIDSGEGKFEAIQDSRGYIRAAIIYFSNHPSGAIMGQKVFIPVEAANKFVRNPAGSKCEFSFNAA